MNEECKQLINKFRSVSKDTAIERLIKYYRFDENPIVERSSTKRAEYHYEELQYMIDDLEEQYYKHQQKMEENENALAEYKRTSDNTYGIKLLAENVELERNVLEKIQDIITEELKDCQLF